MTIFPSPTGLVVTFENGKGAFVLNPNDAWTLMVAIRAFLAERPEPAESLADE